MLDQTKTQSRLIKKQGFSPDCRIKINGLASRQTMEIIPRVLFIAVGCVVAFSVSAQEQKSPATRPKTVYNVFATPVYQFETGLDKGGDFSVSQVFLGFDATAPVSRKALLTLSLNYKLADYDFSGVPGFTGSAPWNRTQYFGITPRLFIRGTNQWNYIVAPTVGWSAATDADLSDSLIYGASFIAARTTVNRRLTIGPAVGLFRQVERTIFFPFLLINWKITNHLTLANPFRAGPAGPGGLELVYTPNGKWEFAGGGAARIYRFRLSDDGPVPEGVGQQSGLPLFARVTRKFGPRFKMDFYAGVDVAGQLRIDDSHGDSLAIDDYDVAPILALTFAGRF